MIIMAVVMVVCDQSVAAVAFIAFFYCARAQQKQRRQRADKAKENAHNIQPTANAQRALVGLAWLQQHDEAQCDAAHRCETQRAASDRKDQPRRRIHWREMCALLLLFFSPCARW
jgi:hypothetical protein